MANRRRNFTRGSGPRRQTEWLSLEFGSAVTALGAASKILVASMDVTEKAKLPFTITRTVGQMMVRTDQAAAIEEPFGAFGGAIVSDRAVAVGITAVPTPVTEHNADYWFFYKPFHTSLLFGATGMSGGIYNVDFDSRAQRKIEEGEDIIFIMANASASAGMVFHVSLRILIKLH